MGGGGGEGLGEGLKSVIFLLRIQIVKKGGGSGWMSGSGGGGGWSKCCFSLSMIPNLK